jgi:hypothetical protein
MLQIKTTLFAYVSPWCAAVFARLDTGRRGEGFTRDAVHVIIDRLSGLSTDFSWRGQAKAVSQERPTGSKA